ncbi:MAG TPA: tRNA epoxyqueuosine(34) reductase QueG [Vicinamibacterales bacterium]|nr:tRNA epoxyqueuosine(34) reductase QueG [Vicinamibacterales bacterium]
MLTSSAVKARARSLGFELCGIAPATGIPELAGIHDWIARGHHGEMQYLERSADVRADVTKFLPGARSVVMTATNYFTGPDPAPAPTASVARYARGQDYHLVLAGRLERLLAWMREGAEQPFDAAVFVDKHWVQERVVAAYAGLGWIGKHSLLINPDIGSWVLLAGIATTLPLAPDRLVVDQCGACTLCMDACPTGAIVAERDVDARKCISYLTIEKDGALADGEKEAVGGHVFGCDVCQEVCPWNLTPATTADGAWQPRATREAPNAAELWRRRDDRLHDFVAGSALTHAPMAQLRRNLALAIGAAGDPASVAALDAPGGGVKNAAFSADAPAVRDAVAWAKASCR